MTPTISVYGHFGSLKISISLFFWFLLSLVWTILIVS